MTPPMITGLRPSASESGPWNGLISPNEMRYADTTSCISSLVTSKSAPICRNAGNGVSMLNGPSIESPARMTGTSHSRRRSAGLVIAAASHRPAWPAPERRGPPPVRAGPRAGAAQWP